jgi:hypothetical protein
LSLVAVDINKDGHLDIVVANYGTSNIAVLRGYPDGSFQLETIYTMSYDSIPYSTAVGEFNNDNHSDIAVVNYGTSNLVILVRNGSGNVKNYTYSTGSDSHPCSVVISDFNIDNKMDIAVANAGTDSIGIFLGNGNGTFQNMIKYSTGTGSRPQFIAVSDFNKDGIPDIIVANTGNNNIRILQGHRDGSFSILMTYSTGLNSYPSSIAIDDFDADSKLDVVIANNGTGNVLVLTDYGMHPHTTQLTYSTGQSSQPFSVVIVDVNNDNYSDIIVANNMIDTVGIFIGLGNGTFVDQHIYQMKSGSGIYFVATGDFDNDKQLDIVAVFYTSNQIQILLGYGDGTFRDGNTYSTGDGSLPYSAVVADFNNDNKLDIVVSNYWVGNIGVFLGYGNGTFMDMQALLSGLRIYPRCVDLGDFNNDKLLDIVAADAWNGLGVVTLLGNGDGSFQPPIYSSTGSDSVNCLSVGDLNKDNRSDIVYTSTLYSNIGVLLGYGNGSFKNVTKYATTRGAEPWFIALGDINKDSWLDIGIGNAYDSNIGLFLTLENGTFAKPTTFYTGYGSIPYTLAFGDLNNDDQLDIVVGNTAVSNIIVFLINLETTFATETSYLTGSGPHPYSIVVGDINDNGKQDVVVANAGTNDVQILFDYNHGIPINGVTYSTGSGSHPQSVILADFNDDHQLDIAVANSWNDNINVFLGFGHEVFGTPTTHSTGSGSNPSSIAAGDINKDGWMDIVVANQNRDNVGVFIACDYTTFIQDTILIPDLLPTPNSVATGDFNNDHQWDIVVANKAANNIGIYLGNGNGTFGTQITYSTGTSSSPVFVAVGDFNNDNNSDIVVADYNTNNIRIFLGYGNGSFADQGASDGNRVNYPVSIGIGDFDNDSFSDIVVVNKIKDQLSIFLGYGNGTFKTPNLHFLPSGSSPTWVAVDDFNNDDIMDIAVSNYQGNNVGILLGYGNGTFNDNGMLWTGAYSHPYSIATGDFNNDSCVDIAVANVESTSIGVFFGYGDGNFSSQKTYSTGALSYLTSISIGQLNKDMFLDIAFSDWGWNTGYANIGILYGFGDGNFTLNKTYPIDFNSQPQSIAIGDFNNDGRSDLAVANSNKHSVTIMLQYQSEPFAVQTTFFTGNKSRPISVAVGDFNNDLELDIAVANAGASNIGIFLGYGNGSFAEQQTYSVGDNSNPVAIAIGDFDHDGKRDVVVANSVANNIYIYFGYNNGTFARSTTYFIGAETTPSAITVADLNKDNHTDIIVTNTGISNVIVFVSLADGTFAALPKTYSMGYNAHPQSIGVGDFNNDSLIDIAIANYGSDNIEILLQTC